MGKLSAALVSACILIGCAVPKKQTEYRCQTLNAKIEQPYIDQVQKYRVKQ